MELYVENFDFKNVHVSPYKVMKKMFIVILSYKLPAIFTCTCVHITDVCIYKLFMYFNGIESSYWDSYYEPLQNTDTK